MGGLIEFQTAAIADIGSRTLAQHNVWDDIWNGTRTQISATAAEALDDATGAGLEERNQEYHRKSQLYSQNVLQQSGVVNRIGAIATDTNAQMVSAIRGGR